MNGTDSDHLATGWLNSLRGLPFAVQQLWLGLTTGDGMEIAGAGYARVLTPPEAWSDPQGRRMVNVEKVAFGKAQMDWPPATGFMLFDAPSGGNALAPGTLVEPVRIMRGVRPVFDPGDIVVEIARAA